MESNFNSTPFGWISMNVSDNSLIHPSMHPSIYPSTHSFIHSYSLSSCYTGTDYTATKKDREMDLLFQWALGGVLLLKTLFPLKCVTILFILFSPTRWWVPGWKSYLVFSMMLYIQHMLVGLDWINIFWRYRWGKFQS